MLIELINKKGEKACGEFHYDPEDNVTRIYFTKQGVVKGKATYEGNIESTLKQLEKEYTIKKMELGGVKW